MANEDAVLGHELGPARQVDRQDGRQELGTEPHSERDREEERFDRGPPAEHVRNEDEQHHDDLDDEKAAL